MGTKRKFWYRDPETKVEWLFKYPREGTGEHWAEKVAAEAARALGIDHATAELAVLRVHWNSSAVPRFCTRRSSCLLWSDSGRLA